MKFVLGIDIVCNLCCFVFFCIGVEERIPQCEGSASEEVEEVLGEGSRQRLVLLQ